MQSAPCTIFCFLHSPFWALKVLLQCYFLDNMHEGYVPLVCGTCSATEAFPWQGRGGQRFPQSNCSSQMHCGEGASSRQVFDQMIVCPNPQQPLATLQYCRMQEQSLKVAQIMSLGWRAVVGSRGLFDRRTKLLFEH